MREHSLRPIGTAVWAACASKLYICVFFLCVASLTSLRAQTLPLSHGERVDYDLYFKWGLIMSKAGLATLSVKESEYQGAPSWHYNLLFRSAGVIEKVFRMRGLPLLKGASALVQLEAHERGRLLSGG